MVAAPVPQIMMEQVAEVIQAIPQERVLERTVAQIKDLPVVAEQLTPEVLQSQCLRRAVYVPVVMLPQTTEILQEQVQQRTEELEHQSQLSPAFIQKELECETNEVSERSAALSQQKLIRTAPRGSEHTDELKPDCTDSSSAHADRAAS